MNNYSLLRHQKMHESLVHEAVNTSTFHLFGSPFNQTLPIIQSASEFAATIWGLQRCLPQAFQPPRQERVDETGAPQVSNAISTQNHNEVISDDSYVRGILQLRQGREEDGIHSSSSESYIQMRCIGEAGVNK